MDTAASRERSASSAINSADTASRAAHQSAGSCSSAPSSGADSGYSAWASPSGVPSRANRPALSELVPTSTPRTTSPSLLNLVREQLRHGLEKGAAEGVAVVKRGALQAAVGNVQRQRAHGERIRGEGPAGGR